MPVIRFVCTQIRRGCKPRGTVPNVPLSSRHRPLLRLCCLLPVCVATDALAQQRLQLGQLPRPEMQAYALTSTPTFDGDVRNDPAWQAIVPVTGLTQVQPVQGAPASNRTEIRVGYTETSLWVGIIAHDDNPETIIVSENRRDASLDQTDSVRFIIDGLLDRQNGYVFGTNPTGMQYDAQVIKEGTVGTFGGGTGGFDENWDGSWEVRTIVDDVGWSAEFEIPFRTLRYGLDDMQSWGFNFQRNIRRNNEIVYWAPIGPQHSITRVSRAGTVHGVEPPPQRNLQITPYVLSAWRRDGDGSSDVQEAGIDIKYSLTPSLTLDATYNTDFAQVEVDDVVVNLDRFSIFLPEKRPFFLENAGQFTVGNNREVELFFSRRIGIVAGVQVPIEAGVRLSGKVGGRNNIGFLYMTDDGLEGIAPANDYVVARVSREVGTRSSFGAIVVGRSGDGSGALASADDENRTYGIDGRWGIGEYLQVEGWAAQTSTPGLTGDDFAFSAKANYNSSRWSSRLNYTEVREDFNPEVGFLRRDDFKRYEFFLLRRFRRGDSSPLLEIRPHTTQRRYYDLDGFLETGFSHFDVHWEFKNGWQFDTGYDYLTDGFQEPFEIIDGVFIPADRYSGGQANLKLRTNQSAPLSLEIESKFGKRYGGDQFLAVPSIKYRVGENFNAELSGEYTSFDLPYAGGDFDVSLARLRLSYSFTPKMSIQAVLQYEDENDTLSTNIRFSMLRTARSGLYLVYNEFDERMGGLGPAQREYVIKYNYLFDVFR